MDQAVHERVGLYHGLESPVECYSFNRGRKKDRSVWSPHYHDYIEFLFAFGECDATVWIGGRTAPLRTGDLLVINSRVPHDFCCNAQENKYICIKALPSAICASDNSFFDMKYLISFSENSTECFRHFLSDSLRGSDLPALFIRAVDEWKSKRYGYEISVRSCILEIFLWIIRNSEGEHFFESETQNVAQTFALIRRAVDYISDNYATVTEADAAANVNMSYSHFSRVFKRIMGKSFKDYLMGVRINTAEKMLFDTSLSVTDIALACGFSSSSHFIDRFKQVKGVTPRKYRKIFTENEESYKEKD